MIIALLGFVGVLVYMTIGAFIHEFHKDFDRTSKDYDFDGIYLGITILMWPIILSCIILPLVIGTFAKQVLDKYIRKNAKQQ